MNKQSLNNLHVKTDNNRNGVVDLQAEVIQCIIVVDTKYNETVESLKKALTENQRLGVELKHRENNVVQLNKDTKQLEIKVSELHNNNKLLETQVSELSQKVDMLLKNSNAVDSSATATVGAREFEVNQSLMEERMNVTRAY